MYAAPQISLIMNLVIAVGLLLAFYAAFRPERGQRDIAWAMAAVLFGLGGGSIELILPAMTEPGLSLLLSYTLYLCMVASISAAVAYGCGAEPPFRLLVELIAGALLLRWATLSMPYDSFPRFALQQAPYAVLQAVGVYYILRHRLRSWVEWNLLIAVMACVIQYPARMVIATLAGGWGTAPQNFLSTDYATLANLLFAVTAIWLAISALIFKAQTVFGKLDRKAAIDPLTGLWNRRGLDQCLPDLERALNTGIGSHAIVLIDLDHFKSINDRHGHAAGDEVLRCVGAMLEDVVSKAHVAARIGGEEFLLILRFCEMQTAVLCAEGLRTALQVAPIELIEQDRVTASFGLAQWQAGESFDEAFSRADKSLYNAKALGRDQVVAGTLEAPTSRRSTL